MPRKTLEQFEEKLQDYLEELKVVEYTRFNRVLRDLTKLVNSAVSELDGELSTLRRAGLNRFINSITVKQKKLMEAAVKGHMAELQQFGSYSYAVEASMLATVTGASVVNATRARAIMQAALERPIGATGDLLEPWVKSLVSSQVSIVDKMIRKAHVNGWTNAQTLQVIRGTKKNNYADGLIARFGKQNATIIKTAMQHVNNSARQVVWAENSDIVKGYRWVSSLDDRTSDICQELDGEEFEIGEGPLPPAHPNCRSTTVAVLDKAFDVLDEGATRASPDGYVRADITYGEWKAEQDD